MEIEINTSNEKFEKDFYGDPVEEKYLGDNYDVNDVDASKIIIALNKLREYIGTNMSVDDLMKTLNNFKI